jgi:hypothetical protein
MGNTLATLEVQLRAEIAQLKTDFAKANQLSAQEMKKMSANVKEQTEKARDSVDLLSDAIGVRLPRELKGVIAESRLVAPALKAAFSAAVIIGFAQVLYDVGKKIYDLAKAAKEKEATTRRSEENIRLEYAKSIGDLEVNTNRELALIGKVGSAKIAIELEFARRKQEIAKQDLANYEEELRRYQSNQRMLQTGSYDEWVTGANDPREIVKDFESKYTADATAHRKKLNDFKLDVEKVGSAIKVWGAQFKFETAKEGADNLKKLNTEIQKLDAELQREWKEDMDRQLSALRAKKQEAKEAEQAMRELNKQVGLFEPSQPKFPELVAMNVEMPTYDKAGEAARIEFQQKLQQQLKLTETIAQGLDQALEGMFMDMIVNSRTAGEAFKSFGRAIMATITQMIAKMWAMYAVQLVTGFLLPRVSNAQAMSVSTSTPARMGLYAPPMRDSGGYMEPGKSYGVAVPELFIPNGGQAIPLAKLGSKLGGDTVIQVDARGSNDPAAIEAAVQRGVRKVLPLAVAGSLQAHREQAWRR